MPKTYMQQLHSLLSPAERGVFKKLSSPERVQDFLDHFPINFELAGETILSPRRVLREKTMHCAEGALFAAASLSYHGRPPLLMDLRTTSEDDDHVVALFKEGGLWGAISKTNHSILRWRDPIYKSPREIAMSYAHEYIVADGTKTLLEYSKPFALTRYGPAWIVDEKDLVDLICDLDDSVHLPLAPRWALHKRRLASPLERKMLEVTEWPEPNAFKLKIKKRKGVE